MKIDDYLLNSADIEPLTDQSLLKRIALESLIGSRREAAVRKLTDQAVLVKIAQRECNVFVNRAAVDRLTDQDAIKFLALKAPMRATRIYAVERLTDQKTLAQIALNENDDSVRCTATENLYNQEVLIQIALGDVYWYARVIAVNRLDDQGVLTRIALTDRKLDVRKAAVKRLHDQSALVRVLLSPMVNDGIRSLAMNVYFSALSNLTEQEALYRVVSECTISEVQEAAAKRLEEEGLLLRVMSEEQFQKADVIRRIVVERLTNQVKLIEIARSYPNVLVRRGAVKHLEDRYMLETLALGDSDWKLRRAVVKKITSHAVLLHIARTDVHELVCLEALLHLDDRSMLFDFIQTAGTDARKKALNRMDADEAFFLRFALNDPHESICKAAAQKLIKADSIEAVLRYGKGAAQLASAKKTMNLTLLAEIAVLSSCSMLQRVALQRSDCWTLPQLAEMVKRTKGINLGLARKRLNDLRKGSHK